MDLQKLKQIAQLCRKFGIKHYKDADFEFTLSDLEPKTKRRFSRKLSDKQLPNLPDAEIPGDFPSDESLLFWSSGQESSNAEEFKE